MSLDNVNAVLVGVPAAPPGAERRLIWHTSIYEDSVSVIAHYGGDVPDVLFHEWVYRLREKGWHGPVRGWSLRGFTADFRPHQPAHFLTLTLRFEPRRGVTA